MPPEAQSFGWVVAGLAILYLLIDRVRAWRSDDVAAAIRVRDEWIKAQADRMATIQAEQDSQRLKLTEMQVANKNLIEAHLQCEQRDREKEHRIAALEHKLREQGGKP